MRIEINLHIKTYKIVSIIRNKPLRSKGNQRLTTSLLMCVSYSWIKRARNFFFFALTRLFDVVLGIFGLVDLPSNFPAQLESFLILLELSAEATVFQNYITKPVDEQIQRLQFLRAPAVPSSKESTQRGACLSLPDPLIALFKNNVTNKFSSISYFYYHSFCVY